MKASVSFEIEGFWKEGSAQGGVRGGRDYFLPCQ